MPPLSLGVAGVLQPSGGGVDLQGAYNLGGASPSIIALDATRGGVQLRGDFGTVGTAIGVRGTAGAIEYFGADANAGSVQVRIGNLSALGPGIPALSAQGATDTLQLWGSGTFTAAPGSMMQYIGVTVHDYAAVRFGALNLQGTIEHRQAGNPFNHFLLFNNGNTYRNSVAVAVNFGPGQAFIDQPSVEVNGAVALTMSQLRSYLSQPRFRRTTAGLGTLVVSTVGQVQLFGSIETGCTVSTWSRLHIGDFTLFTGSVPVYNGILFDNVVGPTSIRHIRSTTTGGTFIDHAGTAPCNFGGAVNFGAGATVDVTLQRGAANRLDLAVGDSLRLLGGALQLASATELVQSGGAGILQLQAATRAAFNAPAQLALFTVAGVPAAVPEGMLIYVTNESGGPVPAFSDGAVWRRVTDRAIIT